MGSDEAATAVGKSKVTAKSAKGSVSAQASKKFKVKLKKASKDITAGGKETLKLKVKGKSELNQLIKLVKNGAKATAKITVTLTDLAGNSTAEKVVVKLKK